MKTEFIPGAAAGTAAGLERGHAHRLPGFRPVPRHHRGIEGFHEALAKEVEPGMIRTTLIEPGMIRTSFHDAAEPEPDQSP